MYGANKLVKLNSDSGLSNVYIHDIYLLSSSETFIVLLTAVSKYSISIVSSNSQYYNT